MKTVPGAFQGEQPDAAKVAALLVERGLTATKVKAARELLTQVERGFVGPKTRVDRAEIEAAQAQQFDALADLRDWFNDWATTLRCVVNVREQIQLGLAIVKRGAGSDDVVDSDAPAPGKTKTP